jgi:hypothetical protein
MLRERLERRDGRSWMPAMALLARAKPSAAAASAAATGAVASTPLVPVIVMSTLAKIGIGVALVAAAAWIIWSKPSTSGGASPLAEAPRVPPPVQREAVTDATHRVAATSKPAAPVAVSPGTAAQPSAQDVDSLAIEIPPATIEGVVLRGKKPVAHCNVYAWPYDSPLPERPERSSLGPRETELSKSLVHTATDTHGVFRFAPVHTESYLGFRYTLGIDTGDGVRAETLVQPLADKPGHRIVIVLGTASIRGHVYDDDGKPREGVRVCASRGNCATTRSTDATGTFSISDLAAGDYWLSVYFEGRVWSGQTPDVMQRVTPLLREGEARTIDIGSMQRSVVWTGTVRTRGGDIVPGPSRILVSERGSKACSKHSYDEQGRFRIPLQAGVYDVSVSLRARQEPFTLQAPLTMNGADVERDIVVPGARLRVSIVDADTGAPWSSKSPRLTVSMHREGHDYPGAFSNNDVQHDGAYIFDGVDAGDWLVGTWPPLSGSQPPPPVRVTVLESDAEVPVRIALHAP